MMTDSLDDVADSTDWLSTPLSGLAAVEAALRCQVCKDFYKTPMLTSCNHTFCSTCIRRALSNDGKCPLCRASEQEIKLRSNWSMEETVDAFMKTRQDVLDFSRRPATATTTDSPKRKRDEADDEEEDQVASSQRSSKRLRSSTRLSKSRSAEATAEMARQEADIQDPSEDDDAPGNYEPDDGLVACPICLHRMKENQVFQHLDISCPGGAQPQPNLSRHNSRSQYKPKPPPPPPPPPKNLERLPAINYSMLKEQQLRKKLQELGISTAGSRAVLERRHKEWMTLWNANCDALRPRRKAELLQDLDAWERTLGTRAPTSSRSLHLGAQIRDKDFDGAAWAARHDNSFKDLIASARKNRGVGKAPETNKGAEGQQKGYLDPGLGETSAKGAEELAGIPPPPPIEGIDAPKSSITDPASGAYVDLTSDDPTAAAPEGTRQQLPNGVAAGDSLPSLDYPTSTEIPHIYR